eukprot:7236258-Prymnesium_polylepis.1
MPLHRTAPSPHALSPGLAVLARRHQGSMLPPTFLASPSAAVSPPRSSHLRCDAYMRTEAPSRG